MLVHRYSSIKLTDTHVYNWMERGTAKEKRGTAKEQNAKARARTARSGDERTKREVTAPLTYDITVKNRDFLFSFDIPVLSKIHGNLALFLEALALQIILLEIHFKVVFYSRNDNSNEKYSGYR